MGDWIKDVVDEIKAGAKEADILKKYNLGNDPTILRQIRGYNYLRTSDSEDAAKTAYPTIYNINQTRQTKQPTPVVPTAQEKQLANQMQGLKEMSKVNRGSDLKQMDKLQPIAEDIDLMSKKAAVDEMFAKNFAASNMGKTMKAVKERKAAEEQTNQAVNTAISSARAEADPMYNMYMKVVNPIFTTAQKTTGNMTAGLIRNLGNVAEFITGDEGISEGVGDQADKVKEWFSRNQSENASKRAGGAFLTEPMQQRGPIFNDGKINTSAVLPRFVETATNMAYLLGGAQVMGGGNIGLMASGYLNVYEDGRDEALASGLNTEQADAFGAINGTIQAALELISPNDIVFGKVKSRVSGEVLKRIKSNMTRSEVIREVAGAYGKELGAENLQELVQMGAEKGLKWLYNETQLGEGQAQFQGTQITKDEILETIVLTTLATGAMASPNIMSETRPSKMKVGAYVTAAENMDAFTEMLQRKVEDGTLAQEEAPVLYGEVEKFARQYAQNKAAGYSEDQAARMAWNDRAKGKLDQIPQSVEGNPTLQSTLAQTVQSAKAELDSDTQDAKMGIPKQGEIVTGDKLAEIMGQIPDKGQPITESRALEYAGKNYVMGQVKLDDLYKSNKKFAKLVDQYQEAKNPTKPAEGQEKKPVDPEITNRIKTSDVNDLRMPAVIDGTDVIDGMHRLAQQYLNGTEYARAFTTIGDNAITDKTESDGKRQEEGQKDVLNTPSPETSVQPEVIAEKPPVADKPAPKPAVVENPARQPFKGKTHNVKYDSKGGRIVVAKNGKPINPESPEAKKVLDQHAKKYNYNIGETSDSKADTAPDFQGNENDMYTWSAENSNNPAELAAIYRSAPSKGNALSEKEQAIARRGISVKMDGYRRFGDMANMTQGKRLKYIRKDGVQIDTLAKEISDETGLDVTPADIINFMDTYPGGVGEALKEQESEAQTIARKKFEQITGIPFTNQVSDIAFKQFMGPEAVKAAEKKLDEDFDSIPDNDIIAAMWEAVDEAKASSAFDPAELEAFIASQTNDNEQTETGPTAEQDPGSEEAVTFDESQDEGSDNQEDLRAAPELNNAEDEVTLGDELDQFIADQVADRDIDSEIKSAKSRYDQAVARLNAAQAKLAKEQGQQSDIFGTGQQAGMFTPSAEDSKAVLDPLKTEVKEAKLEYEDLVQEKANIEDRKNPDMFDGAMAKMSNRLGSLFAKEFDTNDKALDNIAEGLAGDANAQRAVEFIRPILAANPNVKVVPAREGEYSGRLQQALGLSYPDGTITLNFDAIPDEESMFRTLLHEYIHAATRYEIANNSAFKGELENVLADVRDALGVPDSETLISTMQSMGLIEDGKYGTTNAYEMVAEVFSNPEFANYLKGIEYKGDNLLRRIYLAIIRLFDSTYKALTGAKESIDANNLADYLMSLTEAVVKPNQGTGGGTLASMKQKYPADIVRDFIRIKIGNGTDPTILRNMLVQKTGMTEQEADDFMVQALAEKTYDTPAAIRSNFVGPLQEGERARNAAVRMAPALEESIRGRMSDETKKYFQISNKQTEKEAEAFISMYDPDLVYSWLLDPETQKDLNKLPGRSKVYIYGAAIRALNAKAKAAKLNMNFSLGSEYADRARDLGAILFPMGTEAGQTVQAFRMLGDIAPDLVKPMVEKMMEEIEKRMRRNRKKKPEPAPTPEAPAAPEATPVEPVSPEATTPDPGTPAPAPETVTPEEESPGIPPEVRQELLDMADEIEALPKGLPRNKKMMELTRRLAELDVANTSPVDIVQAIWYAHILSGIGTHAKNTFANLFNTFFEFFNLGIREVYKTRDLGVIPFMVKSWWDGLGKGMVEGTNILATGLTRDAVAKFGQSPLFEWFRWKDYLGEKYGKTGKVIGSILDYPANLITSPIALRYVGRALAAADAMMYTANAEMASGALAWEQVRLQNSDNPAAEIWKMTDEMLGNKRDKIEALQKQAESEGFTKGTREFRMRTNELLLETRAEDMNDMGDQYGAKVTFNHEPNGILAPWYRSVTQLTNAHRSVRFFMPFMRIVTNLMENYINYTPLGALKAYQGKREQPSKYFQKLTPDQRAELYIKSGIGLTVAMGAFLLGAGDDDDDGLIEISAAGTGDYQKNYELMKSGWREYSIRVGNKAISYKDSPLFAMLAAIGTASDHYKFGDGDPNNATVLEKFNVSAMGMVNAMFDQSWMSGLDELVTATKGVDKYGKTQNFGGKISDAGINILRSLVVPNFVTQNVRVYNEAMDNPIKRAAGIEKIYRDLPYLNDNLNPIIDVWGEPVVPEQTLSWKPFRLEFDLDEDPLNDFLAKKKIWVGLPERKEVIDYNTGTALPMTDQQYYDYTKLSGQLSKQYLNELLTSGAFEDLSVVDIKRMIDAEKRKAREEAYYTLFTAE